MYSGQWLAVAPNWGGGEDQVLGILAAAVSVCGLPGSVAGRPLSPRRCVRPAEGVAHLAAATEYQTDTRTPNNRGREGSRARQKALRCTRRCRPGSAPSHLTR